MAKIYGVFMSNYDDDCGCTINTVIKTFKDIKKAENYRDELVAEEQEMRHVRDRCLECNGTNYTCPYFLEDKYCEGECENMEYYTFHDDTYYSIVDMELEE